MSELTIVAGVIAAGLAVGWLLSVRFHSESRTLESAIRLLFNLMWLLAAAFMVVGGYYTAGAVLIVLWSYFAFSNARRVREGTSGSWRDRAANWRPGSRSG